MSLCVCVCNVKPRKPLHVKIVIVLTSRKRLLVQMKDTWNTFSGRNINNNNNNTSKTLNFGIIRLHSFQ